MCKGAFELTIRIAINGFGRIGRMVYRRALQSDDIEVVAVNGTADAAVLAHLLQYDSVHGRFDVPLELVGDGWLCRGKYTRVLSSRDASVLPWGELGVDVVVESTGVFRTRETMEIHLAQGARKVVLTAPAKSAADADITVVMGVNDSSYDDRLHHIVSGASCTTNCLAPVVKALHEEFGLESGLMTTVHSYTNDQRNLDNPHKDLRRARASAESIVPTSTGAAKAIGLVLPELRGRLAGLSLRVPTPNVSIVDLVAQLSRVPSAAEVNHVLRRAAESELAGILGYTEEPLVSVDFNGDSRSAIIDAQSTLSMDNGSVKVLAWYDNEWGYSCRMVDLVRLVSQSPNAVQAPVDTPVLWRA